MLVLCPYFIPFRPTKKDVRNLLDGRGFFIGEVETELRNGRSIPLMRWAEENPEFKTYESGGESKDFAIIRIFIQYIENNPKTTFNKLERRTQIEWVQERLSRIVTLWIPLQSNDSHFLLSVGNIDENDVKVLMKQLLGNRLNEDDIFHRIFSFGRIREEFSRGWMHGFEMRPKVIERGTLYGEFHFDEVTELDDFEEGPDGTTSKQEGVIIEPSTSDRTRKVRVLRDGKFQIMGIPKDNFFPPSNNRVDKRAAVMNECFEVANQLLTCTQ